MKSAAGGDLLFELVHLRPELGLVLLERRDGAGQQEVGRGQAVGRAGLTPGDFQPAVHGLEHSDGLDGVEVEGGLGQAVVSAGGVVAGDDEQVVQPAVGQGRRPRLGHVAVHVATGKVHQRLDPHGHEIAAEHVGAQRRRATRVVGDADRVNGDVRGGDLLAEVENRIDRLALVPAAWHQLARDDELRTGLQRFLELTHNCPCCSVSRLLKGNGHLYFP